MNKRIIDIQKKIVALQKNRNRIEREIMQLGAELKKIQNDCEHQYEVLYEGDGFGISGIAPDARDRYYKCKKCGRRPWRIKNR